MTYFPNILPGFVKLLIDFHDVSSAEVQEYLPLLLRVWDRSPALHGSQLCVGELQISGSCLDLYLGCHTL